MPAPDATHVLCTGYDHMPGTRIPYTTNLPLARHAHGVLAHRDVVAARVEVTRVEPVTGTRPE